MEQTKNTDAHDSNATGMSRRGFLKLGGAFAVGGMTALSLPGASQAGGIGSGKKIQELKNELFWRKVRKQFIIDPDVVYMNIGTTGSMPIPVLESYERYNRLAAYHPKTYEEELGAEFGLPNQREKLAAQFGCNSDEICLSYNTTDGLDTVVYGLELQAGDEILTTHHEHIAALSPLNVRQDRDGINVKYLEIPVLDVQDPTQFVDLFESNVTSNTKAILFSHITYKTGTKLPAKELCAMARSHGITSIVDGAHTPGMIQLNFHDIGCDFYAGSGHKWQCGPGGTGILYLRNQGGDLPKFWTQNSSLYTIVAQPANNVRGAFDVAYSVQYRGELNIAGLLAMVDACDMWEDIGRDRIEKYVLGLSSYLKGALKAKFGDQGTHFAPDAPQFLSGLTAFNPFDDVTDATKAETFVQRLQDETGFQIRYTNFRVHLSDSVDAYALRISTHIFHTRDQIDELVDAMYDLYLTMGP